MNKFFVFLCIMLLSFGIARIANANAECGGEVCNITLGSVSDAPRSTFGEKGAGAVETFGQTFKLPEGCTVLDSFTFFVDNLDRAPWDPTTFKAYVMEWDDRIGEKHAIEPVLYQSAPVSTTTDGTPTFEEFMFPTGGLTLDPTLVYVAFISVAELSVGSFEDARVDAWDLDLYEDGSFFFHDQITTHDFSELTTKVWDTHDTDTPEIVRIDLAFNMTFSSPGPPAPEVQLEGLAQQVFELNLQKGIDNSLDAKLDSALNALADFNENNDVAAINSLQAFINAVAAQSGNKIPEGDATELIEAARAIIECLSLSS